MDVERAIDMICVNEDMAVHYNHISSGDGWGEGPMMNKLDGKNFIGSGEYDAVTEVIFPERAEGDGEGRGF